MIVFYSLSKEQQQWIKQKYPKLAVQFKTGKLNMQNLPNPKTEIISIHVDCKVGPEVLAKLPNLKLISTRTTGVDHIDFSSCNKSGVKVVNAAGMNAQSVAEFNFGLILAASRNIVTGIERVAAGHFSDQGLVGTELSGKTIGVIGTGAIGSTVLRIAKGFGMKLLAHDSFKNTKLQKELKFKYVSTNEIFEKADVISLHVPGTKETKHMINDKTLRKVKTTAGIVNTSRGSVVDTKAILRALKGKKLAWYAADVLEIEHSIFTDKEMGKTNKELLKHERSYITPHMAYATTDAVTRVLTQTMQQITDFQKGKPVNFVN
jgi:D-lactate dehydrogenase